jgi:hypothetical protein
MRNIFIALLLIPICAISQRTEKTFDSATYYRNEIGKYYRQAYDSIRKSERLRLLREGLDRNTPKSKGYNTFVIFGSVVHSDYSTFNEAIATSGFPRLKSTAGGFGLGYSGKQEHSMFDFYFMNFVSENKSKKGKEEIGSSMANLFQFDFGFDIFDSKSFSLYPYAGLSFRMATLHYNKQGTANANFTDISNIVVDANRLYSTSTRCGYQAGLGTDVVISENNKKGSVIVLFAKAGVNKPIGKDSYKFEGVKYQPDIKKGDWVVSFGFKFGSRR